LRKRQATASDANGFPAGHLLTQQVCHPLERCRATRIGQSLPVDGGFEHRCPPKGESKLGPGQKPVHVAVVDGDSHDVSQRLDANFTIAHRQNVLVQVAEIAGVMKREDAPATVLAPLVGASHPGQENG
jgi:hypothetical protein